jgi:hypothetical protein
MLHLKEEAEKSYDKIVNTPVIEVPFKHMVIDNFFSNELIEKCIKNFPKSNEA